jgi:hypothetical protein
MDLNSIQKLIDKPLEQVIPNTILVQGDKQPEASEFIDDQVREVVTTLHARFLTSGSYFTLDQLKVKHEEVNELSPVGLEELFKKVNKVLVKRELPEFQINFRKKDPGFDPAFIGACHILSDTSDRRPISSKLKSIGMTTTRWNNYLKIKKNQQYWQKIVDQLMDFQVYNEGRIALSRNVAEGDLPSIKYFNELTGKFVQQRDFDPRIISVLLTSVLDIIVRHVSPEMARTIADEIDQAAVSTLSGVINVPSKELTK